MLASSAPDKWMLARRGIPTASKFAAVMAEPKGSSKEAVTRKNYRIKLALERVTGKVMADDELRSKDVANGIEREPMMLMLYELQRDVIVDQV